MLFGRKETVIETDDYKVQLIEKTVNGKDYKLYQRRTQYVRTTPAEELTHIIAFLSRVHSESLKNPVILIKKPKTIDGKTVQELDFSWTEDIKDIKQ